MEQLNDLKIFGDGTISSGKYNKIKIMGDASSVGPVESETITIMGDCRFKDSVKAHMMKIFGSTDIEGDLDAGVLKISGDCTANGKIIIKSELKIMGEMTVDKDADVKYMKVLGDGTFNSNLFFDEIKILGQIKVQGNCEGNYLNSKGQLDVFGLLSADKIEINPKGRSVINEIGGSDIVIKRNSMDIKSGIVVSKVIEGDNIVLQNTECDVVRGTNITILSGCIIGKVEYKGNLQKDKNSKVGEEVCLKN